MYSILNTGIQLRYFSICVHACLLLAVAKIHGLPSKIVDFVLAFPHADLKVPVYMELPLGFDAIQNGIRKLYILQLNKSLYDLKQVGFNWFAKLRNGLLDPGFTQSNIDACVFFGKGCIVLTYDDDCIIVGDLMDRIEALITSLHDGMYNLDKIKKWDKSKNWCPYYLIHRAVNHQVVLGHGRDGWGWDGLLWWV